MIESSYASPGVHRSITERMLGAARLDVGTYEEVEADRTATGQAAAVVAMVAVASAIGNSGGGIARSILALLFALLAWAVWSGITYLIGTSVFNGKADWGELLRTLGFAQAPGVLYVFGVVPGVGDAVRTVVAIWMLVTAIVAIRQALDISTGKAVGTAIVGWLALFIPLMMLGIFAAAIGRILG
jgi:hypothetical protein